MRKFLMAAALLAVAACGDKAKPADTTTPAVTAPDTTKMKADSMTMKGDSMTMKADSMKMKADSTKMTPPVKKP
jgi:hypothetical protein